jgi:hypothetical protein
LPLQGTFLTLHRLGLSPKVSGSSYGSQSSAVRPKKVPVLPDKCAVDALAKLPVEKQRSIAEAAETSEKIAIPRPAPTIPQIPR